MKKVLITLSLLTVYAIGGYLHRGWLDIPGMLALSLLVAPLVMAYPDERNEKR